MKRLFATLSFLITCSVLNAEYCCQEPSECSFYIKAGSGVSVAESAQVFAPPETWNPAVQGYNSKLGSTAIADLGIGCQWRFFEFEVSVSARSTFKYRKFQTPVDGGDSYKREFDLDVIPILFSLNLLGKEIPCLNWDIGCGKIYPIVGASVGVSNLLIRNYRTTGLAPSGDSFPFPSFSAESQYAHRKKFTYTALVGFEYNYNGRWALATGYRWFDAGKFKGPRFQRVASGAAVDVGGQEWRMRFRSNEWFVEFKLFI